MIKEIKIHTPLLYQFLGRFRRLGIVATVSFLLNVALTAVFTELGGLSPDSSFAITLLIVFLLNFVVTRYWVFGDRVKDSSLSLQFTRCTFVSISFRLLEWTIFYLLVDRLELNYLTILISILSISFVAKSLIYERIVFK